MLSGAVIDLYNFYYYYSSTLYQRRSQLFRVSLFSFYNQQAILLVKGSLKVIASQFNCIKFNET